MNLRWLVGNFADPEFNLTRAQQREVTRLAHRRHLSTKRLLLVTAAMTLTAWGFFGVAWDPLAGLFASVGVRYALLWSSIVICIAITVLAAWLYRFLYIKPVRMAMRDLGYDICIGCGHRLQGLPQKSTQCPECGTPRDPLPSRSQEDQAAATDKSRS